MKLAVIGANGKSGQLIVDKALENGIEVTAITRNDNHSNATHVLKKDLFSLTADDVKDFDVVVDAFGVWEPDKMFEHKTSIEHLIEILSGLDTRLYVVGGAGSLYVDKSKTQQLKDTPDFPEEFKLLVNSMSAGLDVLRKANDVHWVYVSPAADFQADGEESGNYAVAGEILTTNANGESYISYKDYANALIKEILHPTVDKARISVYTK
ncbi:NAD(P)-dependent oxidoreductase [Vagococcus bubulae]|uniref:NADH-flavin reductase n=1 Tax=Vagococcus bubulae TaxID=1977868 RepID=A0A429ZPL4_9ENTE|nr:NAD(P)H-binding protein [Vagococcus bubulae]RST95634.1 NADH-flavin reductase [Vagococcus bubulae]